MIHVRFVSFYFAWGVRSYPVPIFFSSKMLKNVTAVHPYRSGLRFDILNALHFGAFRLIGTSYMFRWGF
jgi:hypothetical protein